MFTTKEKVNLLKKMQRQFLEKGQLPSNTDWEQLQLMGIKDSFMELDIYKKPEEITMQDILAEER